jgi:hypothetical protein
MGADFWSGIIDGFLGQKISRLLGRFRLWKVFVISLLVMYLPALLFGLIKFGMGRTLSVMRQLCTPPGVFFFLAIAAAITFCAYLGSPVKRGKE